MESMSSSLSGPGRTEQAEIARSKQPNLRRFGLARLRKRLDHIARCIANANPALCERLENST